MNGEARRAEIITILSSAEKVISASKLAEALEVSRQVIVQDVALLRANGYAITSHARGYTLEKTSSHEKVFKVTHSDEDAKRELNMIIDLGGIVKDVFVYHKIYGVVKASLNIKTKDDITDFLTGIASGKSSLLKNITAGYHYHTVCADNDEILENIKINLERTGFLAPLQPYEPDDLIK